MDLQNWLKLREGKAKVRTVEVSEKYRSAGNKAFQQRHFDVAAAYYTEAIATAPKASVALALAHANRASTCTRPNAFVEVIPIFYFFILKDIFATDVISITDWLL